MGTHGLAWRIVVLAVISTTALTVGCDDGGENPPRQLAGNPGGGAPPPQSPAPGTMTPPSGARDTDEAAFRRAMEDALYACLDVLVRAEADIIRACRRVDEMRPIYEAALGAVNQLLAQGKLRDEDRTLALYRGPNPNDGVVGLHHCAGNPIRPGENLNAHALFDTVFMVDHLVLALGEASAYMALEGQNQPDDPAQRDAWAGQIILDLGLIFYNANQGHFFEVVDGDTVSAAIDGNPAASRYLRDAITFLVAHELAHANLIHSPIKHMIRTGIDQLERDGVVRVDATQRRALDARLLELNVATEVQADIYALTLLERSDATPAGVALFALGIGGMLVHAGICEPEVAGDRFRDCFFRAVPGASHPPLDARIALARLILDEHRDYRYLLGSDAWDEAYDLVQTLR